MTRFTPPPTPPHLPGYLTTSTDYEQMEMVYDLAGGTAAAYTLIGTTSTTNGGNASISWTGLSDNTEYEWYATVTDPAALTTTGSTWSFTTGTTVTNQPPVVTDIPNQTIAEGATFATISLDNYVSDVDNTDAQMTWSYTGNSALTVSIVSRVATITIPNADWNGAETITFRATDPGLLYDDDAATFTVTAVNDAPAAVDDAYATDEDLALVRTSAQLVANDTDVDGPALSVSAVSNPTNGTVGLVSGTITFTPTTNFNGTAGYDYTVTDGSLTDTGHVTVTVNAINDPPAAVDDAYATDEDLALVRTSAQLVANDTDVDGPALSVSAVSNPTNGTVGLVSGTITFTPTTNFNGTAGYDYTVTDGSLTDTGHVTVTVNAINDAPAAVDDAYVTDEDTALVRTSAQHVANDTDVDGPALSVSAVSNPTNGTVGLVSGTITFTPTANFNGTAGYDYTVTDGSLTDTGHVTVTVNTLNDAPVCSAVTLTINEDTAGDVTPSCSDVDGNPLTYSIVAQGTSGTASVVSSLLHFVPATDINGSVTFTYRANDGLLDSNTADAVVTITPVNDAPACSAVALTINEDTPGDVAPSCTDVDGDTLTYSIVAQGASGNATVISGQLHFVPAADINGSVTFTYQAYDGTAFSNSANAVVTITPINDAPVITSQNPLNTLEDTALTITLADMIVTDVDDTYPTGFTMTLGTGTNYTFTGTTITPAANFHGTLNVQAKAFDPHSASSNTYILSVTVTSVNDAPVCSAVALTINEDTPGDVAPSCTDVDGNSLTYSIVAQGSSGSASVVSSLLHYAPALDINGSVTFTYHAYDGTVNSNTANAVVTITPVNDAPVAVDDSATTPQDTNLVLAASTLATNDVDVENDTLSLTAVSNPTNGTVNLVSGTITFTPTPGFSGTAGFDYTVSDGFLIDTGHVTITVTSTVPVHSIPLVVGWNLVSFNLQPTDPAIATVLTSIAGNYDLVYAWDASLINNNWLRYDPNGVPGLNTLTTMAANHGYWIRMTSADVLEVVGTTPSTTHIDLYIAGGGWNLVAYPSATTRPLPDALSNYGVDDATLLIFAFHATDTSDPWKMYDRTAPAYANDLTSMTPGWGYWVQVHSSQTWVVTY